MNREPAVGWQIAGLVALIALPGFATPKALLVIAFFVHALFVSRVTRAGFVLTISTVTLLCLWLIIGRANGVPAATGSDQFFRVAIFFMILRCAYALRRSLSKAGNLDRICIGAALVAACAKIVIMGLVVFFDADLQTIQTALGFETVTQIIGFDIQRLQFPADFVILFLLVGYTGGRSRVWDAVFMAAISVIAMLSFSRFIFASMAAGIFIRALWLQRVDFIPKIGIIIVIVLAATFSDGLIERFSSDGTDASDETRVEQIAYLQEQIDIRPWVGFGLGYSVPGYTRSDTQPYTYEVQWLGTLMQLGTLGIAWLLVNIASIVFAPVRNARTALCVGMVFATWIASGVANPYLTSLGSALGFSIVMWRAQRPSIKAIAARKKRRSPRPAERAPLGT